ncbi:protein kinase domain protein [Ichthyophthirius multifiliis]|uniref:Protein kinase domain protein n=1 Tax=Ichthyophthirius multifiliis TaxID=5932 RepID=G0R5R6_ICHMU|nr:protein kinase domain protein [Ichthyophthirius multifiliis]EGR27196.1 protein kinase domain protein [Ichthyophthirius multifiliis]|eukprot:XP_004024080.1 protein kinase domain protein [Ichthyophthirius multifiliis]
MGNQSQSSIVDRQLYNPQDFTQAQSLNDVRYGTIKILENKQSKQKVAEITKTTNNEKQWQTRVAELKFRSLLDHPNIVKLLNFNSQQNNEFCSSFYKICLLYEYYFNDLKTEISERRRVRIPYTEGELLYLLQSLASAILYLKSKNVTHGDIRPYNVLLNDIGQVKLGELYIQSQNMSNYSLLLTGQTDDCYISPQLLEHLKRFNQTPTYDASKNEVFSLGMTLLEASTLDNVSASCYNKEQYTLNSEKINSLLSQVRLQYSNNFYQILQKMILEQQLDRISIEQLNSELESQWVRNNAARNISTIEIVSQQQQQIVQLETPLSQNTIRYEVQQPTYVLEQTQPVYPIAQNNLSDLDARVEAILKMSRETVQKYGVATNDSNVQTSYTTNVYTTSLPNVKQQVNYNQAEDQFKMSGKNSVNYVPFDTTQQVNYAQFTNTSVGQYVPLTMNSNNNATTYTYVTEQQQQQQPLNAQQQETQVQSNENVIKRSMPRVQAFTSSYQEEDAVKRGGNKMTEQSYENTQQYYTNYYPQQQMNEQLQNQTYPQTYTFADDQAKRSGKSNSIVENHVVGESHSVTYNQYRPQVVENITKNTYVVNGQDQNGQQMSAQEREAYIQKILNEARQVAQTGNTYTTNNYTTSNVE